MVEKIKYISSNSKGRDFVISDLHGCVDQLWERLKEVEFNTDLDRLFSVGDLVDRGPSSMDVLRLLREPWFYAVRGNHEEMFLQYMGIESKTYSSPVDFLRNGGAWIKDKNINPEELAKLSRLVRELPYVISVGKMEDRFIVCHTGMYLEGKFYSSPEEFEKEAQENDWELLCWERGGLRHGVHRMPEYKKEMLDMRFNLIRNQSPNTSELLEPVLIEEFPFISKRSNLIYTGHTILPVPLVYKNTVFMDTGSYMHSEKPYHRVCLLEPSVVKAKLTGY